MFKLAQIELISHSSKVMLKILQAMLQEYVKWKLPDIQAGFRKGRETRDQIGNIHQVIEKDKKFQKKKKSTSASLTVQITTNCVKLLKRLEYQAILPVFCKTFTQVKKQQLEWVMEQQTGSKLGKEYIKAVYCHPAYLTSMQNASCEMPDWMKHKVESRLLGGISITSDMQMTPPLWQKKKRK